MKNLNPFLMQVRQSDSVALNDRVQEMKNRGERVIALNAGDPNFDTPRPIIEAGIKSLNSGHTHYSNSRGLPELREIISEKLLESGVQNYSPEREILITSGAIHAFYIGLQAILKTGDEILVLDPSWNTHANLINMLGGKAVRVTASLENNFFPSIAELNNAITEKTIGVVINSPNNPTGAVAGKEYLIELVQFAAVNDLYIISDEVYERIIFDGKKHSSLAQIPGAKNRALILKSFSKSYAMTGWRIGYLCAPELIIEQALKASQYSITNVPQFIQTAAIEALTNREVEAEVVAMNNEYEFRRNLVLEIFKPYSELNLQIDKPAGAFYFFINAEKMKMSSANLAEKILVETGVSVVPGSVYGKGGEGFLRLSLAASREYIKEGTDKLINWTINQT